MKKYTQRHAHNFVADLIDISGLTVEEIMEDYPKLDRKNLENAIAGNEVIDAFSLTALAKATGIPIDYWLKARIAPQACDCLDDYLQAVSELGIPVGRRKKKRKTEND